METNGQRRARGGDTGANEGVLAIFIHIQMNSSMPSLKLEKDKVAK
jgi:hypothetical protein